MHSWSEGDAVRKILLYASNRSFRIAEPIAHAGYTVMYTSESGNKLSKFLNLIHIVRKERPDLFLIDSVGLMCVSAYMMSVIFKIPFTVRIRANMWDVYREQKTYLPLVKRIYRYSMLKICERIFRRARRAFPVSTALAGVLERKGVQKNRIRVLYYPVDHDKFRPLKKKKGVTLVSVTNLSFKAKYEALVEVLPCIDNILTEYKDVAYIIVGDGLFAHVLQEAIRKMENADRILYVGYKKNIEEILGTSDIFLHFSRLDGFPAAVVEAMSCELPVVANKYEAMIEQVEEGVTGFLVDGASLKDAITLLVADEKKRKIMGDAARSHIVTQFNIDVIAESFKREIEDIFRTK